MKKLFGRFCMQAFECIDASVSLTVGVLNILGSKYFISRKLPNDSFMWLCGAHHIPAGTVRVFHGLHSFTIIECRPFR